MKNLTLAKRICCILVAVCMLFSVLPTTVFAEDTVVTDTVVQDEATTDTTETTPDDDIITDGAEEDEEDEEIDYSTAYDVASAEDLFDALSIGEKLIRITADFEIDRTFFIISDTIIFTTEAHTLTRAADFGGDVFVVGESKDGTVCETDVSLQLGQHESTTENLLTIDGNRDNMTADVVGTVIFALNNTTVNLYGNVTIKNCFKSGNDRTYNEAYGLSYPSRIGGTVIINAGGVINIYGGNYKNNAANTTDVTTEIVAEDGTVTTDSLSIWGGAFYFFGEANIYGGVFEGNAAYRAGALYAYRTLSIYGGSMKNNTATTYGGAIYVPSSTLAALYINGENDDNDNTVEISGNSANSGGALYLYGQPSTINGASFTGNTASSSGGAIYGISASSGTEDVRLTISNTTFEENSCDYNGGAIYLNETNAYFENVTFEQSHTNAIENSSGTRYGGGAIFSNGTYLDINGATFSDNFSDYHGGAIIAHNSSTIIMNNITAENNTAGHSGGFLRVYGSIAKIYNSAIRKNSAASFGGGVNVVSSAAFEAYLTTFENNSSENNGGAIYIYPGADTTNILHSCSFVGNTSSNFGGAIYIANLSVLNAYNITAKNNSAVSGGFLYETKTSTKVTLNGLTVEGNTATTGGPIIHGNTTGAVLYLNKTNYLDIDNTSALDDTYWAYAIQGSLTVKETTDSIPGFINYGDTEETAPEDIVNPNVTNVIELQSALAAKLKKITIISEFQIDRTFYIDYDTTIYSSGNNTMLRRPYFGGDVFVVGESANGEIPEKQITVTFAPADEQSSIIFDGNKDALTAEVTGTTFFVCNGATLNLKDGISVQNSHKTGNEKTLTENYGVSYPIQVGGSVAIVAASSTLNIYGGNYTNNSVNTSADDESTSTHGGVIYNYGDLNVYGGTFKNNTAYRGGVFYNYRRANIYNALVEENSSTTNGGAIYAPASTLAYLRIGTDNNEVAGGVTFKNNTAAAQGGAIYGQGALVHIENSTFENNSILEGGTNGGALRIDTNDSETVNFIVRDSYFINNTSQTYGGAMYIHSTNGLIENTTFEDNTATAQDGGAAYLTTGSNVEFVSVRFNNNTSGTHGGAVSVRSSSAATLYNVKASGNTSGSRGGAIYTNTATLYVYNSYLSGNESGAAGGAMALTDGTVSDIYDTVFASNKSTSDGGALFVYTDANKVTVHSCLFESNTSSTNGGAIYAANKSLLDLYNITAKNNSADKGGFLYLTKTGTVVVLNGVTLSGNTATTGGPIIWGNTVYCDLHINKNNYVDLDHTGSYDSAYWAAAIYNYVTVTEITDEIPSFDGYGDESYDNIDKAVKVSDSDELEAAINTGAEHIQIISDFELDRTFYITNDTTLFALTPYRLTRADDFAGDIFVVGEDSEGNFSVLKNKTVTFTLGNPNSTTENLLVFDGNCNNMTVDVVGSIIFSCSSSTINVYNNFTLTDAEKSGNARAIDESKYTLSSNTLIGGAGILVESGALNIYGGNFVNNSALGYNGGAIYNSGNVKIYGGKFSYNKSNRGGLAYSNRIFKIYSGNFINNFAGVAGGAVYTANSETAITYIGANTGTATVFFNGNKSTKTGGALYSAAKSTLIIYGDTEFDSNSSQKTNGGAIYSGGVLLLSNITFKNNAAKNAGGAIYCANVNPALPIRYLKFENCKFEANTASTGGAIYASSKANITMTNCSFTENISENEGGAIYAAYESEIKISDSTFNSNASISDSKGYGGAISVHSSYIATDNVTFSQNTASKRGGAIYISYNSALETDSTVVIENSTFEGNNSSSNGGAIYLISRSYGGKTDYELTVKDSILAENSAEVKGGAIYLSGDAPSYYENVTFNKNKTFGIDNSNNGGAIYSAGANIKINKASFTGNSAGSGGGAVYLTGSTADINEATFENNVATAEGGAVSVRGSSTAVINNATLTGNTSGARGGAAYVSASLTVYNSTISSNASGAAGGAIAFVEGGSGNVYKTEFISNTSASEGGALFVYTGGKSVVVHSCIFEKNIASTNGGVIYVSNKSLLDIYNATATDNSADKGGFSYITTTGTTVVLNGITLSGNTATTGGPIIWGNSTGAKLNINKSNYIDLDINGDYDDAYWSAAIYNLLTVTEITDEIPGYTDYIVTYPKEETETSTYPTINVDKVFALTQSSSDANISSSYNKLEKLDNSSNFMSKNTTVFENINGEDVTVDSFVSYNGDTAGNGNFGEGMLILQALQYKKAHPEEDVKISISSFRFSVLAAINVNRNGRYFGYMRNLYGANYNKYGFVRISYLLLCAASMGIDVTVVGQLDAYPTIASEAGLNEYFSSALGASCNSDYVENGVISDYLTFGYCAWKSYDAKGATDMMHTKMCTASHYIDKDGVAHKNAVWTSSSNLDGINTNGTNGNNNLQTTTIISDHAEMYRVATNYIDLVAQYCEQEDVYTFRDIANRRATEQIDLLLEGKGDQIPTNEQIVYIGTENDDVFELYFAPLGGNTLQWNEKYNPYCKFVSAMNQSEDYIEFSWNNVKFGKTGVLNQLEAVIINAFSTNKNPNNKLYINLPGFEQDRLSHLEIGKDIGYMSFNTWDFGSIHNKDLQLSYVLNGQRKYVSLLNSLNIHSGSMCYQSNFMLVIKETDCSEDSVYFTIADHITKGIVEHNYGEEQTYLPEANEDGYTYKECADCGKIITLDTVHRESEWIVDRVATATQKGIEHKECTACSKLLKAREVSTELKETIDLTELTGITFSADTDTRVPVVLTAIPKTFEATVQLSKNVSERGGVIFGNYGAKGTKLNLEVYTNGNPRLVLVKGGKSLTHIFKTDIRSNTPKRIALTIDGNIAILYVDGEKVEEVTLDIEFADMLTDFNIGGDNRKGNTQYFKGTVYSANIFSDVRTAEEIKADRILVNENAQALIYSESFTADEKDPVIIPANVTSQSFTKSTVHNIPDFETSPKTFEATVSVPKNTERNIGVIAGNYSGNTDEEQFSVEVISGGKLKLTSVSEKQTYECTFETDIRFGVLTNIAVTVEENAVNLYINGNFTEKQEVSFIIPEALEGMKLGGDNRENNTAYFNGEIYSVVFFSDVRTEDEILADSVFVDNEEENLIFTTRFIENEEQESVVKLGKEFTAEELYKTEEISGKVQTIEAVIKIPTNVTERGGAIVSNYDGSKKAQLSLEVYTKGRIKVHVNNGKVKSSKTFTTDIRSNEATHIAITINGNMCSLYVNGELKETGMLDCAVPEITDRFIIGGDLRADNTLYFKGIINSVAMFNDIRTVEEIKADVSNFDQNDDALVLFEDFTATCELNKQAIATGKTFKSGYLNELVSVDKAPHTIEAAVNIPKDFNDRGGVIVSNYDGSKKAQLSLEVYTKGRIKLYAFDGTTKTSNIFKTDIRSDKPVYIAVTVSGKTASLYVNGTLKETVTLACEIPEISDKFIVGGDYRIDNTEYFKGKIYAVNMFGDVRTAEEIKLDMYGITSTEDLICSNIFAVKAENDEHNELDGMRFNSEKIFNIGNLEAAPNTIEAVVALSKDFEGRGGAIISNYDASSKPQMSVELYTGGRVKVYLNDGSKANSYVFKTDIRSDKPVHIAVTLNGKKASLYVNGERKETVSLAAAIANVTEAFAIGGDWRTENTQFFKGEIYSVAVYNDVRTDSEIKNVVEGVDNTAEGLLYTKTFNSLACIENVFGNEHTESEWITDSVATELQNGIQHKECILCGKLITASVTELKVNEESVVEFENLVGKEFCSASDMCEVEEALSSAPFTFEARYKLEKSYSSRAGVIFGNYDGSKSDQINIEIYSNGKPRLYFRKDGTAYTYEFKTDIRSDSVAHIALVVDGLEAKLYMNGILKETIAIVTELPDVRENFKVGGDNRVGNAQYFKGTLYGVNIFSDVRTAEEIATDSIMVSSDTEGLVYSKYFMNE